jgi:Mg-chelatase subunit ChlD
MLKCGMIQRGTYLLCSATLICVSGLNDAAAQGTPSQPLASQTVQVYLTARGKHDAAPMLSQSELSASIDKQPAQVTSLRPVKEDKILFALLLDTSKSEAPDAKSIRNAAMLLFQSLSKGGNQGYLVLFNSEVSTSKRPLQPSEAQEIINGAKFRPGTELYDAIGETCTGILSRSGNPDFPRRLIILITDGEDNSSHINHIQAEEAAEKEGVAIFSLADTTNEGIGASFLDQASGTTGGRSIKIKRPEDDVAPLLDAINRQWILSLVPQKAPDKELHSIVIKTKQRDVSISSPAKVFLN